MASAAIYATANPTATFASYSQDLIRHAQEFGVPVIGRYPDDKGGHDLVVAYADDDLEGVARRREAFGEIERAVESLDADLPSLRLVRESTAEEIAAQDRIANLEDEIHGLRLANTALQAKVSDEAELDLFEPENPAEEVLYSQYLHSMAVAYSCAEALRTLARPKE